MQGTIEGLMTLTPNNDYEGMDSLRGSFDLYVGMSSSGNSQSMELRVMDTTCAMSSDTTGSRKQDHEGKMQANNKLIKLLDERLRNLEEEDEILKEEFTKSMKERTQLLNEVLKQFQDMQYPLRRKSQEYGDISSNGRLAIEPIKTQIGTGLMQILFQESNPPLLVTRSPSARAGAIQDLRNRDIVQRLPEFY